MSVIALLELRLVSDTLTEGREVVHRVLEETRAFAGCVGVDVLVDAADETHLVAVETWESPEADAAYRAYRAGDGKVTDLGAFLAGAPVLVTGVVDPLL
jgi:quinol monooxygenase YgiN